MYRHILRKEGLSLKAFADRLSVSRPTLYRMIERYESGAGLGEPYQTVFDSYFLGERNDMYESRNGNLVVKVVENAAENENGTFVVGSETRGKRDIVIGKVTVKNCHYPIGTEVYFPYYAGQRFTLDGEEVLIVNEKDIKLIRKGE